MLSIYPQEISCVSVKNLADEQNSSHVLCSLHKINRLEQIPNHATNSYDQLIRFCKSDS